MPIPKGAQVRQVVPVIEGAVIERRFNDAGDTFEYSSGSSIPTAVGTMRGTYQLVAEDGTRFEAPIPEFALSVPRVLH